MSLEATIWAWEQIPAHELEPRSALVLLALADHVRPDERTCYPGQERLGRKTGQSERTVRRAIGDLEARELIQRQRRMHSDGKGGRNSDQFELYGPAFVGVDSPASVTGNHSPDKATGKDSPASVTGKDLPANGAPAYRTPEGGLPANGAPESLRESPSQESPSPRSRASKRRGRGGLRKVGADALTSPSHSRRSDT